MDQEKIGKFIKEIRKNNNLTQEELANKLGVTFQAVSKWECGKNIPDIAILKQLSELYNFDIDELLNGEKKKKKNKMIKYLIILISIIILSLISIIIVIHKNSEYKFNTISSTCKSFKLKGSIAHNNHKANIYISNIDYCGKPDNKVYEIVKCNLYSDYKDKKVKLNSCKTKQNTNINDYLKDLSIMINENNKVCQNLNNLVLEITMIKDGKEIRHNIPIKLSNDCNK